MAEPKKYIISGEPLAISFSAKKKGWSDMQREKVRLALELRNQHQDSPPIQGVLKLIIHFYMACPSQKERIFNGTYQITSPVMDRLLGFFIDSASGILFANGVSIAATECYKIYDSTPRTEITIIQLKLKEKAK